MDNSDELIKSLSHDLRAVRTATEKRLGIKLGVFIFAILFGLVGWMGVRKEWPDFLAPFVALLGLLTIGVAAFWQSLRSSLPGKPPVRRLTLLITWGSLVTAIAILAGFSRDMPWSQHLLVGTDVRGAACMIATFLIATIPFAASFVAFKNLAPVNPRSTGLLIGLAAGTLGAFSIGLHCPVDEPIHWLFWHVAPILGTSILGYVFGRIYLTW